MVPVAGMPPKNGETKFAMPCAISSWFGSCRSSIMPSATRAQSSDSIAPSRAMVMVGATRWRAASQDSSGSVKAGRPVGIPPKREPIVSTGRFRNAVTAVASTSAMIVPGRRVTSSSRPLVAASRRAPLTRLPKRGQAMITASEARPTDTVMMSVVGSASTMARLARKKSAGIFSIFSPKKSFSCDSAMSTAMPLVNPMMIATGMKRISDPIRVRPMMKSSTPAITVEIIRFARPYCWMMP